MPSFEDVMDLRLDDMIALGPDDALSHHGIKGQKWGVRRYQNADGSLTQAGKARYNSDTAYTTQKSLNDIEKKRSKLVAKRALEEARANKAYNRENDKKYQKHKANVEAADEAIRQGQKLAKKIISDAVSKGYTVNSITKTSYVHTGRTILTGLLGGPVAAIQVAAIDAYRAYNYGANAGGVVDRQKYTVNRG